MKRILPKPFLAAVVACTAVAVVPAEARERHRHHDDDNKGAAVVAGLAVVGIAAAIASKKKRDREERWDRERYYRDDRAVYRNNRWGNSFRPAGTRNTICYRRARTCYKKGHYSQKWTVREFGYDRRY